MQSDKIKEEEKDTKGSCHAQRHHSGRTELCCPLYEKTLYMFELDQVMAE